MNVQQVEACRDQKLNIFACYGSSETAGMVTLSTQIYFCKVE